jgi:hypothetical protein
MDFNGVATSRYYKKNVDPAAATGGEQKDGK